MRPSTKRKGVDVSELFDPAEADGDAAIITECGCYRYTLRRRWADAGRLALWIMLNPSTADARDDDATIRKIRKFSHAFGCAGLDVVNLFAWRATDPAELAGCHDPVGPMNDYYIRRAVRAADFIVCAWGADKLARSRAADVLTILAELHRLPAGCLTINADGSPKHPLYVKDDTLISPYPRARQ
jgi:hypothetical protein